MVAVTPPRVRGEPRRRENAYPRDFSVVSGQRYYSPGIGRWVNRDPAKADERSKLNLYYFVHNNSMILVDYLGLYGEIYPQPPYRPSKPEPYEPFPIEEPSPSPNDGGGDYEPKCPCTEEQKRELDPCDCFRMQLYIGYWQLPSWPDLVVSVQMEPFPGKHQAPISPDWAMEYAVFRQSDKPCCEDYDSVTVTGTFNRPVWDFHRFSHTHNLAMDLGIGMGYEGRYKRKPGSGIISTKFQSGSRIVLAMVVEGETCDPTTIVAVR